MNRPVDPSALPHVTAEQIGLARATAASSQRGVVQVLEEQLGFPAEAFVAMLGASLHYNVVDMQRMQAMAPAFDVLPFDEASRRNCIVFKDDGNGLTLAVADPFAPNLRGWAEERIRQPFSIELAHHADITAYLLRHEESLRAMEGMLPAAAGAAASSSVIENLSIASISEHSSAVVKLVRSTLYDALKSYVSDIHLETNATGLTIKYRLDGVLTPVGTMTGVELSEQVISRLKVMSELDIAERRVPQDGRFKVSIRGREVDFRVSIMPSIFGEDAVLRILDKQALADEIKGLRLDSLGFDPDIMARLRRLSSEPYGMLLVTGPTGSGKTTTLYAAISEINSGQDKIVTIEDPVEYQLPGVLQIPVNEKKGLTFARGLRSILRHDPDKIMVGEIRDPETAQIAIQSALTGHLVFTTVHANNVFDVLGRFLHMGVEPYSFVSALNGVMAQRLVRRVCANCAEPCDPDDGLLADSGLTREATADYRFTMGRGCGKCRGSGYRGRKAIAEMLILNDEIREMIVAREPIRSIKQHARSGGTRFLRESALNLVRSGETTLQEINRVTFVA